MIISKSILDKQVPKEMIPTRLDSAMNLYTYINYKNNKGIIVYNTNPDTWNCLYSFYEMNHKFTIDNYLFSKENITYRDLIEEYKRIYKKVYEKEQGYTKEKRIDTLSKEFLKTFGLKNVTIKEELLPIFELKYSKSKKVWTLYYFENYIASEVDNLDILFAQNIYEQKILPIDSNITSIDGLELASNIPYLLSIEENIKIINNNIIKV